MPEWLKAKARPAAVVAGTFLIAGVLVWGVVSLASAILSGGNDTPPAAAGIRSADSSWIVGQPSLAENPGFAALAQRAGALAQQRYTARQKLLKQIIAARLAAKKRAQDKAKADYERKRREALARYRAAQRRAAILRAIQARKAAKARAEYLRKKRAYERKRRVDPGQECSLPQVRRHYDCQRGKLPARK
jgi:hypothetical protein